LVFQEYEKIISPKNIKAAISHGIFEHMFDDTYIEELSTFYNYFIEFIVTNNDSLLSLRSFIKLTQDYSADMDNSDEWDWYKFIHIIIIFNSFFGEYNENALYRKLIGFLEEKFNEDEIKVTINKSIYYLMDNARRGLNDRQIITKIALYIKYCINDETEYDIKKYIANFNDNGDFVLRGFIFGNIDTNAAINSRMEKYYNIKEFKNQYYMVQFEYSQNINDVIDYYFNNQDTGYAIKFKDRVGQNVGGLTKNWFLDKYNSENILNFLYDKFEKDDLNHLLLKITVVLILGYINFSWLYISTELLNVLYLINVFNDNNDDDLKQLIKLYLQLLVYQIKENKEPLETEQTIKYLTNFNNTKFNSIKEFILLKYNNLKNPSCKTLIDRKDFMRFLAYNSNDLDVIIEMMDLDLKAKPKTNTNNIYEQTEYFTMRETVIIFLTEMDYIQQEESITNQVLLNAIKKVYEDFDWGTNKNNDEEIKLKLENYDNLINIIPNNMGKVHKIYRKDKIQTLFGNKYLTMYFCHLKEKNEIISKDLILVLDYNYEHATRQNLITNEFQKFIIEQAILQMNQEETKLFLKFSTGTTKKPDKLYFTSTQGDLRAHACFNHIEIPELFLPKDKASYLEEQTEEQKEEQKEEQTEEKIIYELGNTLKGLLTPPDSSAFTMAGGGYTIQPYQRNTNYTLIGNLMLPLILIGTTFLQAFR
jgi:hypothetical protein